MQSPGQNARRSAGSQQSGSTRAGIRSESCAGSLGAIGGATGGARGSATVGATRRARSEPRAIVGNRAAFERRVALVAFAAGMLSACGACDECDRRSLGSDIAGIRGLRNPVVQATAGVIAGVSYNAGFVVDAFDAVQSSGRGTGTSVR